MRAWVWARYAFISSLIAAVALSLPLSAGAATVYTRWPAGNAGFPAQWAFTHSIPRAHGAPRRYGKLDESHRCRELKWPATRYGQHR